MLINDDDLQQLADRLSLRPEEVARVQLMSRIYTPGGGIYRPKTLFSCLSNQPLEYHLSNVEFHTALFPELQKAIMSDYQAFVGGSAFDSLVADFIMCHTAKDTLDFIFDLLDEMDIAGLNEVGIICTFYEEHRFTNSHLLLSDIELRRI